MSKAASAKNSPVKKQNEKPTKVGVHAKQAQLKKAATSAPASKLKKPAAVISKGKKVVSKPASAAASKTKAPSKVKAPAAKPVPAAVTKPMTAATPLPPIDLQKLMAENPMLNNAVLQQFMMNNSKLPQQPGKKLPGMSLLPPPQLPLMQPPTMPGFNPLNWQFPNMSLPPTLPAKPILKKK